MSQLNVDVVSGVYDAFEAGEIESALFNFHDDVETYQSEELPWGGRYEGPAGFATFLENVEAYVQFSIETDELLDSGVHVVQMGRSTGEVLATGNLFELREVHLWGVRDGKIVSFQNFVDTDAQLAALRSAY